MLSVDRIEIVSINTIKSFVYIYFRCIERVFPTFEALKTHIRKQHDAFFCDLCTTHIKVSTF